MTHSVPWAIALALTLFLTLTSCGGEDTDPSDSNTASETGNGATSGATTPADAGGETSGASILCGNGVCNPGETQSCPVDCAVGDAGVIGGPESCEDDEDCLEVENCEALSLGCTCQSTPRGMGCVAVCEVDEDCTNNGEEEFICKTEGFCAPLGSMGGAGCGNDICDLRETAETCPEDCGRGGGISPMSCEIDNDCDGMHCRASNFGCACVETPMMELRCIFRCETDDDCRMEPAGRAQVCDMNGLCRRAM